MSRNSPYGEELTEQRTVDAPERVDASELNSWRRGITPQAEIWNGRLAMLGVSLGVVALVLWRLLATA